MPLVLANDTELAHYGVLGMKWGVRNAESEARIKRAGGTASKVTKKVVLTTSQAARDRQARKAVRKATMNQVKNRSLLTDEQLQKLIDRQQQEKKLKDLAKDNARSVTQSVLSDAVQNVAKQAAKAAIAAVGVAAIQTLATYISVKSQQKRYNKIDEMRKDKKSDSDISKELNIPEREVKRIMDDPYPEFRLTDSNTMVKLLSDTSSIMLKSLKKK